MHYQWNIIGHQKQLAEIEHDLATHSMGHAYILSGPGSIGKFTIAKQFACMLQCPNGFCMNCPTCLQVNKGAHLDTIEINDDGESIKIEQTRDIIGRLNMTGQGAYKILLIKNMDRLTPEAANSLLKILEEPPPQTIFIFTTQNPQEILPTIRSRMRIIKFTPVPEKILSETLHGQFPEIEKNLLQEIILLSLGKPGRALQLIQNHEKLLFFRELYQTVRNMCEGESVAERFITAESLVEETPVLRAFLDMMSYYIRHKLLTNPETGEKLIPLLESIQETQYLLKRNINAKLLIENLILKLHPHHV
ncbi:MAG: AAA family ATPase [Patescibacteria group bacterium]